MEKEGLKMQPDCYDYVRSYYGVPAYIGVRVKADGKSGVLVRCSPSQYVHIRFDGETRARGPYHPQDVTYEPVGATPKGA